MEAAHAPGGGLAWLAFALLTVVTWGAYGVLLHTGQVAMGDPANGRHKAFLLVGIAYFITAVLAPLLVLKLNGASWDFPIKGVAWSLVAEPGEHCVLWDLDERVRVEQPWGVPRARVAEIEADVARLAASGRS